MITVSAAFDGGNIEVDRVDPSGQLDLRIRPDAGGEHLQWFHFRVAGAQGQELRMHLRNAGDASYPRGWDGYRAVASYDRAHWFRVPTEHADGILTIAHRPERPSVYYAYFAPYPTERHIERVAEWSARPDVGLRVLGRTLDGRDLDLLTVGEAGPDARVCWIIARQHPGETMAEWLVEGLLDRLLDGNDGVSRRLREQAVFHVVPNMNPDGSARGHLRTNAAGRNLNREWLEPSMEHSPEVHRVREAMAKTGVSFLLDVHGDEILPYNFIAGADGVAGLDPGVLALRDRFCDRLAALSPDFQTERGYPAAPPGKGNLRMATNYAAHAFGCLSMTLEQPFKDAANCPHPATGWSPARCRKLGEACLGALLSVVEDLPSARPAG